MLTELLEHADRLPPELKETLEGLIEREDFGEAVTELDALLEETSEAAKRLAVIAAPELFQPLMALALKHADQIMAAAQAEQQAEQEQLAQLMEAPTANPQ